MIFAISSASCPESNFIRDLQWHFFLFFSLGVIGLNNVGSTTDSINCVIQALSLVGPLRDYFLSETNYRVDPKKPAAALGTYT
jgi:hypothetical protein